MSSPPLRQLHKDENEAVKKASRPPNHVPAPATSTETDSFPETDSLVRLSDSDRNKGRKKKAAAAARDADSEAPTIEVAFANLKGAAAKEKMTSSLLMQQSVMAVMESSLHELIGESLEESQKTMEDEAWEIRWDYEGEPVGTLAAADQTAEPLNYNQTDPAHHSSYTSALRSLGNMPYEKENIGMHAQHDDVSCSTFTFELHDGEEHQKFVDEENETGTTVGVVPFVGGLLGFRETRRTKSKKTKDENIADGYDKFHPICKEDNMYYFSAGRVRRNKDLIEKVKVYVETTHRGSGQVTLEGVAEYAYRYLEQYLKDNSDNKDAFGGIFVSMLPSKDFDAIGVGLAGDQLARKHLKCARHLVMGSGAPTAREILNILCHNSSKAEVRKAVRSAYVEVICNDYHSGGYLHEYEFLHGQDFDMATMHEAVDPIQLHQDFPSLFDYLLLVAIRNPSPVEGTLFERHVTHTCAEVECASLLSARPRFNYYQVLCRVPAIDAFSEMMRRCRNAGGRDLDLPVGFIRVVYHMDGKDILMNVSTFSKELLVATFR